jgi:hypothetical protein
VHVGWDPNYRTYKAERSEAGALGMSHPNCKDKDREVWKEGNACASHRKPELMAKLEGEVCVCV